MFTHKYFMSNITEETIEGKVNYVKKEIYLLK